MRAILLQFLVTTLFMALLTYVVVGRYDFRSEWNALWWIGVPAIVAVMGNRDAGVRVIVGSILTAWGLVVVVISTVACGIDA